MALSRFSIARLRIDVKSARVVAMKRFQFSLRDLVWVIALCAIAGGWWSDRVRMTRQVNESRVEVQKLTEDSKQVEAIADTKVQKAERYMRYAKERVKQLEGELRLGE